MGRAPGTRPLGVDTVVVGGGVVGLAVARALALAGRSVTLLEAESRLGTHTSSRSSEVVHAGIYYAPGSLKARLCVEGNQLLYGYCQERGVAHRRLGKVIVATRESEVPVLARLRAQAEASGVTDLEGLSAEDVRELEPAVTAVSGLLSPSTGIVDSHGFLAALERDAVEAGVDVVLASPVTGGAIHRDGLLVHVGGREPATLACRVLVNAAGLFAQDVARAISGIPAGSVPPQCFAKGHYFALRGPSPFRHLVYPVPAPGGLGVHVTLDLEGNARFGPDVAWRSGVDYAFEEGRDNAFYAAIRAYYPALPDGALSPAYTGVRPKIVPEGAPAADFLVQGPTEHGVPGLINLYGIESPGLTAALALADLVTALVEALPG